MKWLYAAADVILRGPETPLSRLSLKKVETCRCLFWGLCLQFRPSWEYFSWYVDLEDFISYQHQISVLPWRIVLKKQTLSFWGSLCLLFIFVTVHLSSGQLSVAISVLELMHVCVFQIVGMIMEATHWTASPWVTPSQGGAERGRTGKHWAKSKMNIWDTEKRYMIQNAHVSTAGHSLLTKEWTTDCGRGESLHHQGLCQFLRIG